ncbi:MAG TPA: FtsX-like permease family protein [Solirubrobacteraceae bacterium]|nr:FtsX-like permease family protein [Solirubrobacteraceae bacterium]
MARFVLAQLRGRGARTAALLAGIVIACASLGVLVSTARTQNLQVRGTLGRSFRSRVDILVRPTGSQTPLERRDGLVRDDYLSGIFGGITMAQYLRIAKLPGVQVAAPIAMIGYVLQPVQSGGNAAWLTLTIAPQQLRGSRELFSVQVTRITERGLVHLTDERGYAYVTNRPLALGSSSDFLYTEQLASGNSVLVCPQFDQAAKVPGPFSQTVREAFLDTCVSTRPGGGLVRGRLQINPRWTFPFLLAAIDPQAEARLDGLKASVVHGRYLGEGAEPTVQSYGGDTHVVVPVLASTRPYVDDTDEVTVSRLSDRAAQAVIHARTPGAMARLIDTARPQSVAAQRTFTTAGAYSRLLDSLTAQQYSVIDNYWTSGPTTYRQAGPREVTPLPVSNPLSIWHSDHYWPPYVVAPVDSAMTAFRPLQSHPGIGTGTRTVRLPTLRAVGEFDPSRLNVGSALGRVPLGYTPARAGGADARTRTLLHGQDLLPDSNVAGYLQPPPLLLTDLGSLRAFSDPEAFPTGNATDPISVVRVRVAGVHGDDPLSRARVRAVAQEIARTTGLQVDETIGSSPTAVTVNLPGDRWRPALELSEGWIKKGVSLEILTAIDQKTKLLIALILLVGGLFVANAATAAVRARRSELAVLAALGWSSRSRLGVIIGELAVVGLVGGVAGMLIAAAVVTALGDPIDWATSALAIPAALGLTALAGALPAARAAVPRPVAAIRPPVLEAARARHARSILGLSLVNLLRVPGRTLLGALSMAIGVGALTVLVAVATTFKNLIVGTLLGTAVSVQVAPSDYAAAAVIIVLAAAAIGDILYLNQRDRAGELATLSATGWSRGALSRLTTSEGLWMSLLGSIGGGALGLVITGTLASTIPPQLVLIAAATATAGLAAGLLASAGSTLWLLRLPTVTLLSTE